MSRLRILLLGPDSNPNAVSIPFVSYSHAAALSQLHDVTSVIEVARRGVCAPRKSAI